jgi:hypothetical protein
MFDMVAYSLVRSRFLAAAVSSGGALTITLSAND